MLPSTSRDQRTPVISKVFFGLGVAVTGLIFLVAAWQRRWIADDGLIVLRTVRNLLAGNGPVFNAGERVETNTSVVWTYLVWFFSWLSDMRLEYVVLTIALVLSTAAVMVAMIAARTVRTGAAGALFVPAGMLVYIAVPPARDFATSGLETCLVIFWLASLWLLMVRWSTRPISTPALMFLAFWAGMGELVRPELVIVSGIALLMIFLSPASWLQRVSMVVFAGAVPILYQIWRMGYYGLPYPNTAVSKDAGGAKWGQGFKYLANLVDPYWLWLPVVLLLIGAGATLLASRGNLETTDSLLPDASRASRLQASLRTPTAQVVFILVSGLLLGLYAIRVGGDFMHGRTLLPVLFCFMMPIAVLPLAVLPVRRTGPVVFTVVAAAAWIGTIAWVLFAANSNGMPNGTIVGRSGIVDERAFYSLNTGHRHPLLASDYLDYPRMRPMVAAIENTPDGGLLLPSSQFTYWDVVPPTLPIPPGGKGHTVFFLNLGMTSMNVGLDVKVIDQQGLAYPLASHTERLVDGRIGHDKALYPDWVVADLGLADVHPYLPYYMDEDWVAQAKTALTCPATQELFASYRAPLTEALFVRNVKKALDYAAYRIDRVPKYADQECNLAVPPTRNSIGHG